MKTETMAEGGVGSSLCCTLLERPDLRRGIERVAQAAWPEFLLHGNAVHWSALFLEFAEWQVLLLGPQGEIQAVGHAVPLPWDGTVSDLPPTIDAVLLRAMETRAAGARPTALSALAAMVVPEARGRGLSSALLRQMMRKAADHRLESLIAPVRPVLKDRYARVPMEEYVAWTRTDGSPFDPWIRVHWRLGAERLAIRENMLTVEHALEDWIRWIGRKFPRSGGYVVPGALQPVLVDLDRGVGRYEDPNVWMRHRIAGADVAGVR